MNPHFFLITLWVGLFSGGDFTVGTLPDRHSVTITTEPTFNHVAYPFLDPSNYLIEYEIACVHIVGGKANLQYIRTFEKQVFFKRMDSTMTVFSVKYQPIGKAPEHGTGTATGMGQQKFVYVTSGPVYGLDQIEKP